MNQTMSLSLKRLEKARCEVRFVGTTSNTVKAVVTDKTTGKKVCTGEADTNDNALAKAMAEFDKKNPEAAPPKSPIEMLEEQVGSLVSRTHELEARVKSLEKSAAEMSTAKKQVEKSTEDEKPKDPPAGDKKNTQK
jgi:hypothetical protein